MCAPQLGGQPFHPGLDPSQDVHAQGERFDHRGPDGLGDAQGLIHIGDPQAELVADVQQGVRDFEARPSEGSGDLVGVVRDRTGQVRQGDFAVGHHLLQLVRSGAQPLVQQSDILRGLLQQLAYGLGVHHATGEGVVDGLHEAGNLLVGLAGRLEQHGHGVVVGDGLIDGAKEL